MEELSAHPAAEIFPLMDGQDLDKLALDIQAHGLLEPICLYEGQILDGRNRYRACLLLGVEPSFTECDLNGVNPVEYALSKNLHRRHLTTAQRATLALDLLPYFTEAAAERRRWLGKKSDEEQLTPEAMEARGMAAEKAAEIAGVGLSTVQKTIAIQKRNPRIIAQMRAGEIRSVDAAARSAGFVPKGNSHSSISDDLPRVFYGKGDKWREASQPILRYLQGWERRGFEFRHLNHAEAKRRLKAIQTIDELLTAAKNDLEQRAIRATTRVEGR